MAILAEIGEYGVNDAGMVTFAIKQSRACMAMASYARCIFMGEV